MKRVAMVNFCNRILAWRILSHGAWSLLVRLRFTVWYSHFQGGMVGRSSPGWFEETFA
jgi:hypothetical protein